MASPCIIPHHRREVRVEMSEWVRGVSDLPAGCHSWDGSVSVPRFRKKSRGITMLSKNFLLWLYTNLLLNLWEEIEGGAASGEGGGLEWLGYVTEMPGLAIIFGVSGMVLLISRTCDYMMDFLREGDQSKNLSRVSKYLCLIGRFTPRLPWVSYQGVPLAIEI